MSAGPSIHVYCVDATNLVRGGYGYAGPDFRAQEDADAERLVDMLAALCERLGSRVEIDVYFDGAFRAMGRGPANMRLRFTHETKADDLILDRVRSRGYSGGGGVTVVTGDGELGRQVEAEGGKWLRARHGAGFESVLAAIERRWSR